MWGEGEEDENKNIEDDGDDGDDEDDGDDQNTGSVEH